MKRYEVHPRHGHRETLITRIGGKTVNLMGKTAVKHHPATDSAQAWTEKIPGATQSQLKAVHERGDKDAEGFALVIETDQPSTSSSSKSKDKDKEKDKK